MTQAEAKKLEDEVREQVDKWADYLYLNASGMSLEKARTIRVKAKMEN